MSTSSLKAPEVRRSSSVTPWQLQSAGSPPSSVQTFVNRAASALGGVGGGSPPQAPANIRSAAAPSINNAGINNNSGYNIAEIVKTGWTRLATVYRDKADQELTQLSQIAKVRETIDALGTLRDSAVALTDVQTVEVADPIGPFIHVVCTHFINEVAQNDIRSCGIELAARVVAGGADDKHRRLMLFVIGPAVRHQRVR